MTFTDIFKSSFLDKVPTFSLTDSAIALAAAFLVGMFIYLIYRKTFSGVMYSRPFNVSLVALTILTTFVILAVTSNIIVSLGMVGALSIVRFRTAIKDPMDLVFLFWAIGAGIVIGAGLVILAVLGSAIIGILLLAFVSRTAADTPYMVIVNCRDENAESHALAIMKTNPTKYRLKSKTVSAAKGIELVLQTRLKGGETQLVNDLSAVAGVTNAVLVSVNAEYAA